MDVETTIQSRHVVMERSSASCCRSLGLLALVLLTGSFSLANAQTWNGSGPFPAGANSRTVHALAIDPATGTVYAGTGSGTVFALDDAALSRPPEAFNDVAVTNPGSAIGIPVLTNDVDPEGALDATSVAVQADPGNGTAVVNADGSVTYTPDAGFVGDDSFTYAVDDLAGNTSNEATVSVRVNAPPNAANDSAIVPHNEPVTIDVLANDMDSDGSLDAATVAIADTPDNGSAITEADGRITYEPAVDFAGVDSFAYTVGDNAGGVSNAATVTVTVNEPPNVPPTAVNDAAATVEGTPVTIAVLANDSDADGTLVSTSMTVQDAPGRGSVQINADGTIGYTPNAGFSGTDTFTYTVADDDGASSNAASVSVTVTAAGADNTSPVVSDDVESTVEGVAVDIDVLANDSDADGALDASTVTVQSEPGSGNADVNADGSITYTPDVAFTGTDSFTYTVEDDDGAASSAATVLVTVTADAPDNEPPAVVDDAATTDEATPVTIDVLANDSDAEDTLNPATVTVQAGPDDGNVEVNADGTITYTPAAGFSGTDTFTYTVADDVGEVSDAATVTVTVNAASNPPSGGGGEGGGGGATGLLFLFATAFVLVLRRAKQCGAPDLCRADRRDNLPARRERGRYGCRMGRTGLRKRARSSLWAHLRI